MIIYPVGISKSCTAAAQALKRRRIPFTDHPSPEVTHLLLDVPSFDDCGRLRDGSNLQQILERLPQGITVIGGNLHHPELDGYALLDLLSDEDYLATNAAVTADCAIRVAGNHIETTFYDTPTLILGWGRIGKCLANMLRGLDCPVTIAARKETDRAMIRALQFTAVDFRQANQEAKKYPLIFNTVPEPVFHEAVDNTVAIDLASRPGFTGGTALTARGLPGKLAPESSGKLIANTIIRRLKL